MGYHAAHAAPTSSHVGRRSFLGLLTLGAAVAIAGYVELAPSGAGSAAPAGAADLTDHPSKAPVRQGATTTPRPRSSVTSTVSGIKRVVPDAVISGLPIGHRRVAWTVDDGTDSAVVGAYAEFLAATGIRLTFFPNGTNPSWTEHAATLRPMIESGQVQVGNHTWDHPDLTTLSDSEVADEITRNDTFLRNTFGVSGRPFLRPPYGFHNDRTDHIAADLGYTAITMWYGSLGDSSVLTSAQVLANAQQWMTANRIVIGHSNHPGVVSVLGQIKDLLVERKLQTVTLNDVFVAV
ncbi:MAG: polysaccharide deacetylase family protein [Jatrophihabitantaceae bacterium]